MRQQAYGIPPIDKNELRRALGTQRKSLSPEGRRRLSLAAAKSIIAGIHWQRARAVALYMAVQGEADTAPLLADARDNGKKVLLPVCSEKEAGVMRFALCSGQDALRPGLFNIPAPFLPDEEDECNPAASCDKSPKADPTDGKKTVPLTPDLIIVPGLAFDRKGTRLGRGGGYYDRLLALPRYAHCLRLGLAYSFQLVDSLPREDWDMPVHAVSTEEGMLWISDAPPLPILSNI